LSGNQTPSQRLRKQPTPRQDSTKVQAVEDRGSMAKKISKNMAKVRAQVEDRPYSLADAVPLLKKVKYAKFDETVDLTLRLGVDPSTRTRWSGEP
jgi:hypothetical protein